MRVLLYVLVVVDGNGESVVIALWITGNEEWATISALMEIFIKYNDPANIKCVMADKDMTDRDVIWEKLPDAALQICLFDTLRREGTSDEWLVCLELIHKMSHAAGEEMYRWLH